VLYFIALFWGQLPCYHPASNSVQQISDSDDFYQHIDPVHCKLSKSLIGQFLRVPLVQPTSDGLSSASAVPPQFATISPKLFESENVSRAFCTPEFSHFLFF
jgi:hypothetical protein